MNNREKLIDYVKNGGDKFICSPQIGAYAGFDSKIAGKQWLSETTLADTRKAWELFDVVPLYNVGLPDMTQLLPDYRIEEKEVFDADENRRYTDSKFVTPKKTLSGKFIEDPFMGKTMVKHYVTDEEELDDLENYLDRLLEISDFSYITAEVQKIRQQIGDENALDIQWSMQPYELMCFPDTMNTAIFAMTCRDQFVRLMDKILRINEKLLPAVAEGGADFVFLGGPGSEMISPQYYEDFIVPYSKIVSQMAHQCGLLIYSHICSPIEPMLTKGYYNQMGIDLFETLSPPPVGNIKGLEDAFGKLDSNICTRGNVGLNMLMECSAKEIWDESMHILEVAHKMGRKHILGASDYMFYGVPIENVKAMADAVNEFNSKI